MAKKKMASKEGKVWGHGEFANMPQDVKMQAYPRVKGYTDMGEDDTMTRLDREAGQMEGRARSYPTSQH